MSLDDSRCFLRHRTVSVPLKHAGSAMFWGRTFIRATTREGKRSKKEKSHCSRSKSSHFLFVLHRNHLLRASIPFIMSSSSSPFPLDSMMMMTPKDADSDDSSSEHGETSSAAMSLSWRNDRTETHSDWSLCVRKVDECGQERGSEIYHVHKNMLALGARSSEYFGRLFQTAMKEQSESACKLELHPLQAAVVPNILDYLYAPSDEEAHTLLDISTSTATALYSLGDYWEIVQLRRRVKAFVCKAADLQLHNLKLYYSHAHVLRTHKIMEQIQQVAATNLVAVAAAAASQNNNNNKGTTSITTTAAAQNSAWQEDLGTLLSLAQVAEIDFWLVVWDHLKAHYQKILQGTETEAEAKKAVVSSVSSTASIVLVAACAFSENSSLSLEIFHKLTDPAVLPSLDVHTAFPLLSLEKTLVDHHKDNNNNNSTTTPKGPDDDFSGSVVPPSDDDNNNEVQQQQPESLSHLQRHFVNALLSLNDAPPDVENSPVMSSSWQTGGGSSPSSFHYHHSAAHNNNQSWELTSLQERCVDVLCQDWTSISYDDKCVELLMSLENPYLVSRLMVGALAQAKTEAVAAAAATAKPRRRILVGWPSQQQHNKATSSQASSSSSPTLLEGGGQQADKKFRPPWLPKKQPGPQAPPRQQRPWLPSSSSTNAKTQQSTSSPLSSQSVPTTTTTREKPKPKWWNKKTTS